MVNSDQTFFTNEPNRDLYTRFSVILQNNTQFFDVLVGYFRTSGFYKMYPALGNVEKIRILVGLNVDNYTVKIIDRAEDEMNFEALTIKEGKEVFSGTIEKEFNCSLDLEKVETGVRVFIDWLKSGKLEMKIFTESPIHAKVYIMRKNMVVQQESKGSVITGSSNFSAAGLQNNLEFNVELKDSRDIEFALSRFEELWAKGTDIKDTFIETIEEKTWLREDITPYELYLKTLYEFFKEEINSDKDLGVDALLPDSYMQLQYQIDAVVQAKKILEAHNGVFISDVVGLGKTYICAMLARSLPKGKKLIICPPVLVDYWKEVLLEFDVAATVESLGKLDKLLENGVNEYKYIFVDEAHRFRNQDTSGFQLLHEICFGKKVILISATPINNYSSDIENQIYLFQPKHNSTIIPNYKNLEGFFTGLNVALKKCEKGTKQYELQLHENSEKIRDSILRNIMIRRTRGEIMKYYKDDLAKQNLSFPKLGSPEKIVYTFDAITDNVFKDTINVIKHFNYARYAPLLYIKDKEKYAQMLVAQKNMGGFMKGVLVKRLESSFYAFNMTLNRFIQSYESFINMYKTGEVYISKKVDVYELLDSGDDLKLMTLIDEEKVLHFSTNEFEDRFLIELNDDLSKLKYLKKEWENIQVDPKLEQLQNELDNNKILIRNKIIVFTESKETATYLCAKLSEKHGGKVIVFSGDSNEVLKHKIEQSYNPKYESDNVDKYSILITTDVLAEGVNLHRSNVVINYDLPWNPTRIMQRVGRINRVGTTHDRIYVFNFFPTAQSSKQLPLKERIMEKLQAFHDTLGEDFKYLSDAEQISSQKLFEDLNRNLDAEDELGSNPELAYLMVIRNIRDVDAELFGKIKYLPQKAKIGKFSETVVNEGTISFIRKGALKSFFKTEVGVTKQLTFIQAIDYIKADVKDKQVSLSNNYYNHLSANKRAFDDVLVEDRVIVVDKVKIMGNDAKIIKWLKALQKCSKFVEQQDEMIIKMIELWKNGEIPQKLTKTILNDLKMATDELKAYYVIYNAIPPLYFEGRKSATLDIKGDKQVVLSCYMKNMEVF